MIKRKVKLNNIKEIKDFQSKVSHIEEDVDIVRNHYVVDAKSLLGIFTIDLSKPFDLVIHTEDEEKANLYFSTLGDVFYE